MADALRVTLVTPNRELASEQTAGVIVPSIGGQLTILPLHAPLLCALDAGLVQLRAGAEGRWHRFFIDAGFLEVGDDKVVILAQAAESLEDLDADKIRTMIDALQQELAQTDASAPEFPNLQAQLRKNQICLDLLQTSE